MKKRIILLAIVSFIILLFSYFLLKNNIDDDIDNWIVEGNQERLNFFLFDDVSNAERTDERIAKIINAAYSENFEWVISDIEFEILKKAVQEDNLKSIDLVFNSIIKNNHIVDETLLSYLLEEYLHTPMAIKLSMENFFKSQDKHKILFDIINMKSSLISKTNDSQISKYEYNKSYYDLNNLQNKVLNIPITYEDTCLVKWFEQFVSCQAVIKNLDEQIENKQNLLSDLEHSVYEIEDEISRCETLIQKMEAKRDDLSEIQWISGYITDEVSPLFPMTARSNDCAGLYEFSSGSSLALVCMKERIFNRQGYTRILVEYVGDETAINEYSGHKIYLPLYVEVTELELKYRKSVVNILNKTEGELDQLKRNPKIRIAESQSKKINAEINLLLEKKQDLIDKENEEIKTECQKMAASYI